MSSRIEASPRSLVPLSQENTPVFDRRSFIRGTVGATVAGVLTGGSAIHLLHRSLQQGEQMETLQEELNRTNGPAEETSIVTRMEEHEIMSTIDEAAAVATGGTSVLSFGVAGFEVANLLEAGASGLLK